MGQENSGTSYIIIYLSEYYAVNLISEKVGCLYIYSTSVKLTYTWFIIICNNPLTPKLHVTYIKTRSDKKIVSFFKNFWVPCDRKRSVFKV